MDHGACGWSAQRLGRNSVQADFDGSPMVTDIMHDATALELACVLGERNEGFIQMTYLPESYGSDGESHAERHYEDLARVSGRPILYNVVLVNDAHPDRFPSSARVARRLPTQGASGLWPGRNDGTKLRVHVQGLEPMGRHAGLA